MDRKEPQVEVPWIPTMLFEPVPLKPVPIYTLGERNQKGHHHQANRAVACIEFSLGNKKICGSNDAADSGKAREKTASDAVSSYSKLGFREHLFAVGDESRNSSVTQQGDNDRLMKKPFVPSFIFDNASDQETYIACCGKRTSQDSPFTLDNADKEKSRQRTSMQINMEENDPGGEERNVPTNKFDNNVLPISKELCDPVIEFAAVSSPFKEDHNPDKGSNCDIDLNKPPQQKPRRRKKCPKVIKKDKPQRTQKPVTPKSVQSEENPAAKRKYVRRKQVNKTSPRQVTGELSKEKMPESAQMSCTRSLNFDERARDQSYAVRENPTVHPGSEIGAVMQEMNVGLACDLITSMKPKENPTGKRKYVRWKGVNKTSAPPTEMIGTKEKMSGSTQMSCTGSVNFDERARYQSYAVKENPTVCLGSEIGVVMREMNVGLACDLITSMTLEENPTAKRKYVGRKRGNKTSAPPTEVTGELTKEKLSDSAQVSCTGFLKFDERARDQSYAVKDNSCVCLSSEIGVVMQEMNVSLACDLITSLKLEENPTAKRKYVRRNGVNKTSAPPRQVTGELSKEKMPESTQMSCTRFLNFDERERDQSYAVRENPTVHPGSEIGVVIQEMNVGLACDLITSMTLEENPTAKRRYVRRKRMNMISALPREVTGELTKEKMSESAQMSCIGSINFDERVRDQSYAVKENPIVHPGNEIVVVMPGTKTKENLTSHHRSRKDLQEKFREMSRKVKRRDDDGASNTDCEGHAPPKKSFKKDSDSDPDSIIVCKISKNRKVSVRKRQGRSVVDIREFYVKDDKQMPGKKGISLTMDQWNVLCSHVDEIDNAVGENS